MKGDKRDSHITHTHTHMYASPKIHNSPVCVDMSLWQCQQVTGDSCLLTYFGLFAPHHLTHEPSTGRSEGASGWAGQQKEV